MENGVTQDVRDAWPLVVLMAIPTSWVASVVAMEHFLPQYSGAYTLGSVGIAGAIGLTISYLRS